MKYLGIAVASLAVIATVLVFTLSYALVRSYSDRKPVPSVETATSTGTRSPSAVTPGPREQKVSSEVIAVKPPDVGTEKVNFAKREKFFQQLNLMTKLDVLDERLSESSAPHFCAILCNGSEFKRGPSEHPVEALLRVFEQEGAKSFDDPKFRTSFESTFPIRQMFPRSARDLLLEIDQFLNRRGAMTA